MNILKEQMGISGKFKIITYKAGTKEVLRETDWYPNMIMLGTDTGKELVLDRLNATNTYTLNITHLDIGTGSTPPTIADTILDVPVARTGKATGSVTGNVLALQFFFADVSLPNTTYYEIGTFIDGTATISTGRIFNRALFGVPYLKSANEDTTLQVNFTIN